MQGVGAVASAAKTFIENGLSSTVSVKAKNLSVPGEVADVVRLFFLYQDNIETRLLRIKKANEMALEFMATVNEQIVGLSELAEELEGPDSSIGQYQLRETQPDKLNYQIKPQKVQSQIKSQFSHGRSNTFNGTQPNRESQLAPYVVNRTPEDFRRSQIITNLVEMKESVVAEVKQSQAAVGFILNYLQGLNSEHRQAPKHQSGQQFSAWLLENLDIPDFLEETHKFFYGMPRQRTHTPGGSGSSAGFAAEKPSSQSDTPKGLKSTATSGQGQVSNIQMSPSDSTNHWLQQISKLKRDSEQKTNEINGLLRDNEELREQCARIAGRVGNDASRKVQLS